MATHFFLKFKFLIEALCGDQLVISIITAIKLNLTCRMSFQSWPMRKVAMERLVSRYAPKTVVMHPAQGRQVEVCPSQLRCLRVDFLSPATCRAFRLHIVNAGRSTSRVTALDGRAVTGLDMARLTPVTARMIGIKHRTHLLLIQL